MCIDIHGKHSYTIIELFILKMEEGRHGMALDLEDKILLITGGTGSFGNGVTARLLETGIREIRIFSRDE